jgi:SAM-dependent methyltransferase
MRGLRRRLEDVRFRIEEHFWDSWLSIGTYGLIQPESLGLGSDSIQYSALPYRAGRTIFNRISPEFRDGAFLDYGCGMGRVLVLAARNGFRHIIGVEFSERLCEIARRNCRARASIIQTDAAVYEPPASASVFFLYNPFRGATLEAVMTNIEDSVIAHPRQVAIVTYMRKYFDAMAGRRPWIEIMVEGHFAYPSAGWAIRRIDRGKLMAARSARTSAQ